MKKFNFFPLNKPPTGHQELAIFKKLFPLIFLMTNYSCILQKKKSQTQILTFLFANHISCPSSALAQYMVKSEPSNFNINGTTFGCDTKTSWLPEHIILSPVKGGWTTLWLFVHWCFFSPFSCRGCRFLSSHLKEEDILTASSMSKHRELFFSILL